MKVEVKYKNVTIYLNKMENGWWNAKSEGCSISQIGENLEELIVSFGDYMCDLQKRFNKKVYNNGSC